MQDSEVADDVRTRRVRRILVTGWAVVACGIACLIVVGLAMMMSLVFPSGTLFVAGSAVAVVGVAGVVVASVLARRGGGSPQPVPQSRQNAATLVVAATAVVGVVLGIGTVYAANSAGAPASAAIPDTRMTVDQAARAYLEAAQKHDCWYTYTHTLKGTFSWCSNPEIIDFEDGGAAQIDPYTSPGVWGVEIWVTTSASSDETIPAGSGPWSLYFVHSNGIWMLEDQGLN